jgi:hypothetical protein
MMAAQLRQQPPDPDAAPRPAIQQCRSHRLFIDPFLLGPGHRDSVVYTL